jgi:CheY-like chemotaxis protein
VLGIMERQLDQLVRLVDDLMDVARFTNGKIALRRERLDPAELLDAAVEACRPALDAAGHVLTVRMAEQPLRVLGDRVRLVQVVSNLLANAIKYSDAGSPIALELAQDDAHVLIRVRDHGVGVDPAMMPRLWDMFGQVRGTLRRAQGGLGIGLSLVKRLVEMHDGAVGVQSEGPGYGSTFTVRLPRMRIETGTRGRGPQAVGATPASAPPSIGADGTAAPLRVLVVDDNADGADCLAEALRMAGHRVVVAYDARQALASAAREPPDAVLLDLGLPDLDGFDVARRLRSAGGTRRARLVAISGWGSHADKQRSRDAGIDVHLTKPAALSEVLQALEQGALRQAGSAR